MRPPDLPGGNKSVVLPSTSTLMACFNEAAGFTRRKPAQEAGRDDPAGRGFNEAAGFTRRKPRGAEFSRVRSCAGFNEAAGFTRRKPVRVALDTALEHELQ